MQLSFQYEYNTILFDVSYSRRKTISISVAAPGLVRVAAPAGLSEKEVIKHVKRKARWIVHKLDEVQNTTTTPMKKQFINGEPFMYLGSNYPLQLIIDAGLKNPVVELYRGKLMVTSPTGDKEAIKKGIEVWYRIKAREQFRERLEYYQPIVGVIPTKVRIKDQQKRWGSCSSLGNLNFNWRAVMAPSPVLDYLIVHELCHLVHLNHSQDFWHLVCSIIPDYKEMRNWLKKSGSRLSI